ncbi:hypothetical protein LCGC14_1406300 [marine sediment metagenome]|uniref:Uncharacterized protein n=1 Tax=marine sediment metagenome TaxID=412755 RepID=A0A0F9JVL7_9ZZZZ
MTTTKINIGLALSRNFDKVTLEMLDEPISHETEDELIKGIRKRFDLLRTEVEKEFENIQK